MNPEDHIRNHEAGRYITLDGMRVFVRDEGESRRGTQRAHPKIGHYGRIMMEETGVNRILELPGKHFFHEDQAPEIAEAVAHLIS